MQCREGKWQAKGKRGFWRMWKDRRRRRRSGPLLCCCHLYWHWAIFFKVAQMTTEEGREEVRTKKNGGGEGAGIRVLVNKWPFILKAFVQAPIFYFVSCCRHKSDGHQSHLSESEEQKMRGNGAGENVARGQPLKSPLLLVPSQSEIAQFEEKTLVKKIYMWNMK
jgi:hypothetical protein